MTSSKAREDLVACLKFQFDSAGEPRAKNDLLDINITSTWLINDLGILVKKWPMEILFAVKGHHYDGPNGHAGGKAVDLYLLRDFMQDDWALPDSKEFQEWLTDMTALPHRYQIGLGGPTWTPANVAATRLTYPSVFQDGTPDHVHFGIKEPY